MVKNTVGFWLTFFSQEYCSFVFYFEGYFHVGPVFRDLCLPLRVVSVHIAQEEETFLMKIKGNQMI